MDKNDFLRIQQALRYNERTNHVVGDYATCVSNDVRITVGKTEHLENVHATIHARDDGEVAFRGKCEAGIGKLADELRIFLDKFVSVW